MNDHQFILRYQLSDDDCDASDLAERLGEAGCRDALVGMGVPSMLALDFTRKAPNARQAILSAVRDVEIAVPTATLIKITPDVLSVEDAISPARRALNSERFIRRREL